MKAEERVRKRKEDEREKRALDRELLCPREEEERARKKEERAAREEVCTKEVTGVVVQRASSR